MAPRGLRLPRRRFPLAAPSRRRAAEAAGAQRALEACQLGAQGPERSGCAFETLALGGLLEHIACLADRGAAERAAAALEPMREPAERGAVPGGERPLACRAVR